MFGRFKPRTVALSTKSLADLCQTGQRIIRIVHLFESVRLVEIHIRCLAGLFLLADLANVVDFGGHCMAP